MGAVLLGDKAKAMQESSTSIFERNIDPIYQALFTLGAVLVVDIVGSGVSAATEDVVANRFPWLCAASFLLFFALFNSILSAAAPNMLKYWQRSIYSFMGLAIGSGLLAWAFSSLTISEAGSYRWIFIVVTVGYLVFLSMIAFLKKIVNFAQKEEWNKPKFRQKKRR
jgi:MFS family permease